MKSLGILLQLLDQPFGPIASPPATEGGGKDPMFLLHEVEYVRDPANSGRSSQQSKCVAGGRGIDDHTIVRSPLCKAFDFEKPEQFVDAGKR